MYILCVLVVHYTDFTAIYGAHIRFSILCIGKSTAEIFFIYIVNCVEKKLLDELLTEAELCGELTPLGVRCTVTKAILFYLYH